MMLVEEAGEDFDNDALLNGELTPVFFGSALANFGVQNFLNAYVDHAPMPNARQTNEEVEVSPIDTDFSGFIFKIQANMDQNIVTELPSCVLSVVRLKEVWTSHYKERVKQKITRSTSFMADDKETVNHAVAEILLVYTIQVIIKSVIHWLAVNRNIVSKIYHSLHLKYL